MQKRPTGSQLIIRKAPNMRDFLLLNREAILNEVARRRELPVNAEEVHELFAEVLLKICKSGFAGEVDKYGGAQLAVYLDKTITSVLANDVERNTAKKRGGKDKKGAAAQLKADMEERAEEGRLERDVVQWLRSSIKDEESFFAVLFAEFYRSGHTYESISEFFGGFSPKQVERIMKRLVRVGVKEPRGKK